MRDVKRVIKLIEFFYHNLKDRPPREQLPDEEERPAKYPQIGRDKPSLLMRSYILALGLCYHSRLYEKELRRKYKQKVVKIFSKHVTFDLKTFDLILREEQEDNIKRMTCPPNTVFNEALLENVFVVIVCILNKIPAFIVGSSGLVLKFHYCVKLIKNYILYLTNN